jgi:predicted AAA+ superfamily ATPase
MYRKALEDLIKWKDGINRKPLIIRGARQVGKTWLMKRFGETFYKDVAYINFDNNNRMAGLFEGDLNIERLILGLQIESGVLVDAATTLIIFDEVQEVPKALTSLKYFHESASQFHIIAAGSLLGVALHPGTSFPVGKVDFLDLYPLDFIEFLIATDNQSLVDLLNIKDFDLITSFKGRFIDLLKHYYFIGGMPEAVASFIDLKNFKIVRDIQNKLLLAYEQDFSKHAPGNAVPRIRMLWNSVPSQLAKENRKFIYGLIRQGARAREYELAMHWLIDCGLIQKVNRISKPGMPLTSYQDTKSFKLFVLDVGLLATLSQLDYKSILEGNRIFEEFKGALTEQYVLQQLKSNNKIVPLEVKSAENLQAKSLKNYVAKYSPSNAVRTSMSDYRQEEWLINLPLYAISLITDII